VAIILADRVKESVTTEGLGRISFSGATYGGFQTFSDAIGDGNQTYYCIQNFDRFEIGIGTYRASDNSLSRDTILQSSNSDNLINLVGISTVFCVIPADKTAYLDENDDFDIDGNVIAHSGTFDVIRFADTTLQTTAALPYASGSLIDQNAENIVTNSGYFQSYIDSLDHSATEVSGWARSYTDTQDSSLSGWADSYITQASGSLQDSINETISELNAVSGALNSSIEDNYDLLINTSGYFESRVDSADSEILANSGYFENRADSTDADILANSGYFESRADSADSEILANSGYFESRADSADSEILANSGYFENRADSADSEILANSGYFESRADSIDDDVYTVSGLLTPSGENFDFTNNILTYNNSYGGSFTADLSSLSTFDTSGVSLSYGGGILTYTNNAGGTFDVDISSISGDVYAMIVDGAPSTLDTLNEIAAALNDDANVANTLTTLISTTSGNLQSSINDNDSFITAVSGYSDSKDLSISGYFESRVDSADSEILANSGYFQSTSDQLNSDIITVSGLTPTGIPSGITFFADDASLTGNNTFTYDGTSVYLDGTIFSSGERMITSDEIFHIKQLTQAEYDAITPDSATFYIITDASEDAAVSGYFEARDTAISGYFQGETDQLNSDLLVVSGLTPTGIPSGITFFANDGDLDSSSNFIYDGNDVVLSGNIMASGKRVITSDDIYHIEQITQAEYDAITPDSATFYIITDAPSLSGYLTTQDAALSGYFESRDTSISGYFNSRDIDISGYFENRDSAISGYLDVRDAEISGYVEAKDNAIISYLDSADSAISGYFETRDISISGYFESRVDSADLDILANSGYFQSTSDQLNSDIITVSGLTPTGIPSGMTFFADDASLTGNNTLIYDGSDISLSGNITASGKHVVTSDAVKHIEHITQAEYDLITPDASTFYIITDANEDAAISGYFEARDTQISGYFDSRDTSISGYFESRADQADLDILTVSGLTPTGLPSGLTFFADDGSLTGNNTLVYDGNNISLSGTIFATGERIVTSDEIFHIKQLTQAEYDAITPDSATFYIITDASEDAAVSGYFEARDTAISGYFEGQTSQLQADIITVSGLTPTGLPSGMTFFADDGSLTGNNTMIYDGSDITLSGNITASGKRVITSDDIYHIEQITQAEYDAITPDSATFYIITDAPSVSGYFNTITNNLETEIDTVSGLIPTGTPSGINFFNDQGAVSGNNTFIYDGVDVSLSGNIIASGKRVITSDEIYHIKQLTQSEYDAITPDAATFYIITDPDIEGPVVQPIRTVGADAAILTTDYTIHATAGLNLTLPSAVGNGGIVYNIKNISANTVIVSGVGGETIDGQTSFSLSTQYQSITLQSTNSNWIIL